MSHSPPINYTDGVPVKISEKYKPPPEIHLTTKLTQQLLKTKVSAVAFEDYNFDLEHKILSKTTEWINWRQREKSERQQRIQQREISRQKRLEAEQKVKLNQVCYPSTDDLSCDDDEEEENRDSVVEATHSTANVAVKSNIVIPSENFNTILMPTQAVNQPTDKKSHRRYASNSSNKIDFSFFESDASPFDNLEIKSMNEMEELAKVLQSSTAVSENQQDSDDNTLERNNSSESEPSDHPKNIIPTDNNDNDLENAASKPSENDTAAINPYSVHNYNPQQMYANNFYYGMPSQYTQQTHQFSNSPYLQNHHVPNNCYYTQNYAVNHMNYAAHGLNMSNNNNNNMACENSDKSSNKSRSVPDLIKELNDELNNSEKRRIRNISQSNQKSDEIVETTQISNADDELKKLPAKSQILAKQICQMGFKVDMVIRALMRLGDNDKKVVEHLISLNEILQMGFEEERISEALIKFDNNKDQALDYLIS